ncbi:MAG TPA: creatininase family protein [Panacibacter sp.]|nr:creatininase family protein [Panacibacter sp.]HNP44428.1 creatininase family protein [Panacibacter sp.]
MEQYNVKYAELRPEAFRQRLKENPLAYLPLGTLEWHGEHLPLGADAIQSEALMIACAEQFGGIVLPPLFLGPDRRMDMEDGSYLIGMDYAKSTNPNKQLTGSCYWVSDGFFKELLKNIVDQLKRAGFRAVYADGHGPSRRIWTEMIPAWEEQFGLKLFGVTDSVKKEWSYMTDHAAKNETSISMHVAGSLVDLSVFKEGDQSVLTGVNGEHPFNGSAAYGAEIFKAAMKTLEPLLTQDFN